MDAHKREFVRRVVAGSFLAAIGAIAVWELIETRASGGGQPPVSLIGGSSTQQSTTQDSTTSTGSQQSTSQTSQTTSKTSKSSTTTQQVPPGYVFVTGIGALAGKSYAYFNHPTQGLSILVSISGQWRAFSATCTHAPCTVGYSGSQIQCPCHGGTFDATTGAVTGGPPPTRLPEFGVIVQNSNLYVSSSVIN